MEGVDLNVKGKVWIQMPGKVWIQMPGKCELHGNV